MTSTDTSAWQIGYRFSKRPNAVEVPEGMRNHSYSADDLYDSPPIGSVITYLEQMGETLMGASVEDETGFVWYYEHALGVWLPGWPSIPQGLRDDNPDELAGA